MSLMFYRKRKRIKKEREGKETLEKKEDSK